MKNYTLLGALVGAGVGMGVAYAIKKDKAIGALLGAVAGFGAGYLGERQIEAAAIALKQLPAQVASAVSNTSVAPAPAAAAEPAVHGLGSYFRSPWRRAA